MLTILEILMTFAMIYIAFWAIRPIQFQKFMPYTPMQAAFLKVSLAVGLGFILTQFLMKLIGFMQTVGQFN